MKIFFIILILFWAGLGEAATYWAHPSGVASACTNSSSDPGSGYLSLQNAISCLKTSDTIMLKAGSYFWHFNLGFDLVPGTPTAYTTIRSATGNRDVTFVLSAQYALIMEHTGKPLGVGDCRANAECRYIEFNGIFWDGSARADPAGYPMFKMTGGQAFYDNDTCWNDKDSTDCPGSGLFRFRNFRWRGGVTNANTGLIDINSQGMGFLGCFQCEFINGEVDEFVYGMYLTAERNVVDGVYFHDNLGMAIQIYDNGSEPCHQPGCNFNYAETPIHSVVRNSRFTRNGIYSGATCYLNPPQLVLAGPAVAAYNNIFTEGVATPCNPSRQGAVLVFSFCDQCLVYNNSFHHQNMAIYISYGTRTRIFNNAGSDFLYDGGGDGPAWCLSNLVASVFGCGADRIAASGTNSITASPGWVNITNGNAQLTASSPFRDVGTDLSSGQGTDDYGRTMNIVALDANGIARSGTWDLGACEFGTAICPNLLGSAPTGQFPTITIAQPTGCVGTATACTVTTSTVNLSGTSTPGSP